MTSLAQMALSAITAALVSAIMALAVVEYRTADLEQQIRSNAEIPPAKRNPTKRIEGRTDWYKVLTGDDWP